MQDSNDCETKIKLRSEKTAVITFNSKKIPTYKEETFICIGSKKLKVLILSAYSSFLTKLNVLRRFSLQALKTPSKKFKTEVMPFLGKNFEEIDVEVYIGEDLSTQLFFECVTYKVPISDYFKSLYLDLDNIFDAQTLQYMKAKVQEIVYLKNNGETKLQEYCHERIKENKEYSEIISNFDDIENLFRNLRQDSSNISTEETILQIETMISRKKTCFENDCEYIISQLCKSIKVEGGIINSNYIKKVVFKNQGAVQVSINLISGNFGIYGLKKCCEIEGLKNDLNTMTQICFDFHEEIQKIYESKVQENVGCDLQKYIKFGFDLGCSEISTFSKKRETVVHKEYILNAITGEKSTLQNASSLEKVVREEINKAKHWVPHTETERKRVASLFFLHFAGEKICEIVQSNQIFWIKCNEDEVGIKKWEMCYDGKIQKFEQESRRGTLIILKKCINENLLVLEQKGFLSKKEKIVFEKETYYRYRLGNEFKIFFATVRKKNITNTISKDDSAWITYEDIKQLNQPISLADLHLLCRDITPRNYYNLALLYKTPHVIQNVRTQYFDFLSSNKDKYKNILSLLRISETYPEDDFFWSYLNAAINKDLLSNEP